MHLGATLRWATLSLIISFVSCIETAPWEGKHAGLLLQDIEGAFDGVSHAQLLSLSNVVTRLRCPIAAVGHLLAEPTESRGNT